MHTRFHVIKDPVHGTMQFTQTEDGWVKPFIDSDNFQRLRHIKQLGLGDFIFPGAVHSRFNHSLGCCYVASQIAQKIGLAEEERQLVMIACLLHDLGHGPFSHAFEGIFDPPLLKHEDWTPHFLNDYATNNFFEKYNKANLRYPLTDAKFALIAAMIMHKPVVNQILADIVSSQLDADRLDYLLRDNHFCGVRYGEFDFRWMLHCLAIVETEQGARLGITHKGIGVAEHYLMARRLMTRNIYLHKKKLALEALLVELLRTLAKDVTDYPMIAETRIGEFLRASHAYNEANQVAASEDQKQQFLQEHYPHYRELCDYDIFALIKVLSQMNDRKPATEMAKRLQRRLMPKIVRINQAAISTVENEINVFKKKHPQFNDWQLLLIKTPHRAYSGEEDPIQVVNEYGAVKPLEEFSLMINAISDRYEEQAFIAIDAVIAQEKIVTDLIKTFNNEGI